MFFDAIKDDHEDFLNDDRAAPLSQKHALHLLHDGGEHGGCGQPETIQEAHRARTVGQTGRGQPEAVWPHQVGARSGATAHQARGRFAGSAPARRRGRVMKSPVVKRSIVVAGHKTGVSLEEAFWNGMKEISRLRDMTLSELVGEVDSIRQQGNLSSAIRLFVLDYFRTRANSAASDSKPRCHRNP